jgi:polysaccharide deacetylase family protein (PEP-CTERM system associated)
LRTLLLSVDFEDWHQLARRRVGAQGWEEPGPALPRQIEAMLELFDELGVRATFFLLGMAARAHPDLVRAIAAAGHEIGCHGDEHLPVFRLTREEFAADLREAAQTIADLAGQVPVGYRAPAFSITARTPWAYEVLAEQGFRYDASEHDTPRIKDRVSGGTNGPHEVGPALWEFPVAVWRASGIAVPVGGASYWTVMPRSLVLHGLQQAGELAGLYLHPYELDPQPLRLAAPPGTSVGVRVRGALRAAQRNAARRGAAETLRAIAGGFQLIPYGEAHAQRDGGTTARP